MRQAEHARLGGYDTVGHSNEILPISIGSAKVMMFVTILMEDDTLPIVQFRTLFIDQSAQLGTVLV